MRIGFLNTLFRHIFRTPSLDLAWPLALYPSATMPSSTNTIRSTTTIGRAMRPNTRPAPPIPSNNRLAAKHLQPTALRHSRRTVRRELRRRKSRPPSSSGAKRNWSARPPIWSEERRSCGMAGQRHVATIGHRCPRNTVRHRASIRTSTWRFRPSSRGLCANCTICGCVSTKLCWINFWL